MKFIKYIQIVMILFIGIYTQAQSYEITGHVSDLENNHVLQSVLIEVLNQGNGNAVISDNVGKFTVNVEERKGELLVTSLGYKTQIIEYDVNRMPLNIQLRAQAQLLNEVRVKAYGGMRSSKETPGAVAHLDARQLKQGAGTSMKDGLNSIPGVQMDQSTLSEARISIRGNGIRSPWGIRGIKIYLNDIPLTEADGTSRIEGIDVNDLGQVEVIRGPASSIFGGGTGGVVNFRLERAPYQEHSVELSSTVGSYGLRRVAAAYRNGGEKFNSYVSHGYQFFDGYREHSSDFRNFLSANFQVMPSDRRTITLLINRTTQDTQIPGALTEDQVKQNRQQASESNLDKQAGRKQTWTRIGASQLYHFNSNLSNTTSLFTYFYDLDHPLAYAYLRNYYQSLGGRTRFDYNGKFQVLPTRFTIGAEINNANSKGTQYVNNHGQEGNLTGNTDYTYLTYSIFYQSETHLSKKTSLTLGISYNSVEYDVMEYLYPERSGVKKFKPQFSPRIALSHNFGEFLSLHAGLSTGFNAPTGTEIQNEDGTVNQELGTESGINYEVNAKGNILDSRLAYDLALFHMDMQGELIPQAIQQGITIYHNAGKTMHRGLELILSYSLVKEDDNMHIKRLRPYFSLTYSDFKFKEYKVYDENNQLINDYKDKVLPGIAPWVISTGINMNTKLGLYGDLNYYYSDRFALNDANTDYNEAYGVLNFRIGYEKLMGEHFNLNIYAGIDNLTDAEYSSFTALNAVGYGAAPAYFNPSAPLNWYSGISLKYLF